MKNVFTSKLFWANAVALALYFSKDYLGFDQVPTVDPSVLAFVNILLRFVTSVGVYIPFFKSEA